MFICNRCKNTFTEEDLGYVSENYGECWGYPAYKREWCCPLCKGEVEMVEE